MGYLFYFKGGLSPFSSLLVSLTDPACHLRSYYYSWLIFSSCRPEKKKFFSSSSSSRWTRSQPTNVCQLYTYLGWCCDINSNLARAFYSLLCHDGTYREKKDHCCTGGNQHFLPSPVCLKRDTSAKYSSYKADARKSCRSCRTDYPSLSSRK